ncbi:hypothetical protein GCM10023095_09300 [Pseudaeromonas paramecii]|uniref:Uncharacterized protein n=1 Tax=Pseudaeromonas paramecii TaxID=2138166 RepID=A0ABP8Q0P7_9GAMM
MNINSGNPEYENYTYGVDFKHNVEFGKLLEKCGRNSRGALACYESGKVTAFNGDLEQSAYKSDVAFIESIFMSKGERVITPGYGRYYLSLYSRQHPEIIRLTEAAFRGKIKSGSIFPPSEERFIGLTDLNWRSMVGLKSKDLAFSYYLELFKFAKRERLHPSSSDYRGIDLIFSEFSKRERESLIDEIHISNDVINYENGFSCGKEIKHSKPKGIDVDLLLWATREKLILDNQNTMELDKKFLLEALQCPAKEIPPMTFGAIINDLPTYAGDYIVSGHKDWIELVVKVIALSNHHDYISGLKVNYSMRGQCYSKVLHELYFNNEAGRKIFSLLEPGIKASIKSIPEDKLFCRGKIHTIFAL